MSFIHLVSCIHSQKMGYNHKCQDILARVMPQLHPCSELQESSEWPSSLSKIWIIWSPNLNLWGPKWTASQLSYMAMSEDLLLPYYSHMWGNPNPLTSMNIHEPAISGYLHCKSLADFQIFSGLPPSHLPVNTGKTPEGMHTESLACCWSHSRSTLTNRYVCIYIYIYISTISVNI